MAKLPTVSSPLPRDLQQFVRRVREALEGTGLDSAVTVRQLVAAGIAGMGSSGLTTPDNQVINSPSPPTNVTTSGALATVIVQWDGPFYSGHSYSEVWAAERTEEMETAGTYPVIGDAVMVGMTVGNNFSHVLGSHQSRWYWVRNVNRNGVASAFNALEGTLGETSVDHAYVL